MNFPIQHWPFSVDAYHRMIETGILREDDRVELLQGEIIRMSPIGRIHAACVDRVYQYFCKILQQSVNVRGQNPILLDDSSEPQPDVTVLKRREDFYAESLPTPADVLLLIEVADSSVEIDREVKLPLYAKAGIVEVWIVNVNEDQIEAFSEPTAEGYRQSKIYQRGDSLSPASFPQHSIRVSDLLG